MKIRIARRIAQTVAIALLFAIPILNKEGITVLSGSLYSLAIGPVWITDPLSGVQTIITTLGADSALLLSLLLPLVFSLLFGRVFCGWICPQNTLSELFDYISRKSPLARGGSTEGARLLKSPLSAKPRYAVMVALLITTAIAGFPVANLISAPGIISVEVTRYFYEGSVGYELGLVGLIILFEMVVIRRAWCNYVCPVGSFLGLFRVKKTLKVAYRKDAGQGCSKCGVCARACQLGLNPMGGRIYPLCHNCGDCISACGSVKGKDNPLSFRF